MKSNNTYFFACLFIFMNMCFHLSFSQSSTKSIIDANGNVQTVSFYSLTDKPVPNSPNTVIICACPPIAGVTCSVTGTTNTGTSTAAQAGCPHVGYCDGPGTNNPWTSVAGTGTIMYIFSAPVSNATLRASSVNTNDYATVSTSGGSGGTISISGVTCMGVSGLVLGPLIGTTYGGVIWTVNSTGSYTNVTLTNTGAQSGWVATCPTAITVAALPIELVSFTGICNMDNKVDIKWKTAMEKQNDYFTIERSKDAQNWDIINKMNAAGNSVTIQSYNYTDRAPLAGQNYYRLKQTDRNGNYKYSEIIGVENCNGNVISNLRCFPNPNNGSFTIQNNVASTILIQTELGLDIYSVELNSTNNFTSTIDHLTNGVYFISSGNSKQKVVVIK